MKLLFPLLLTAAVTLFAAPPIKLPAPAELPVRQELPDPLAGPKGDRVDSKAQWPAQREYLKALFQEYEYGRFPAAPARFTAKVVREDPQALGGKALLKEITLTCAQPDATIHLLLITPKAKKPAPVFVGLNFNGNHEVLPDPKIRLPQEWMRRGVNNRADDSTRGAQEKVWNAELLVDRGYGLATFYNGDFVPDNAELAAEKLKQFAPEGSSPGNAPATIAAWAWGLSRAVDYLVTDPAVEAKRIAVVGHSRNGKTALLAAAMDERFALAIPSQAGCGGTAPCRVEPELAKLNEKGRPTAETLAVINKAFPHWFCGNFKQFNEEPARLPFDLKHALIALCAPRPVLVSNATEDLWANPAGQFDLLKAADPVYRLVAGEGLDPAAKMEPNHLVASRLGYFIRPGKHEMSTIDWSAWLDYADRWLK